jgi:hypothetical protein
LKIFSYCENQFFWWTCLHWEKYFITDFFSYVIMSPNLCYHNEKNYYWMF